MFVLTEISISSLQSAEFTLNGYRELFCTRDTGRVGGIAIYDKHLLLLSKVSVDFANAESLAVNVSRPVFSVFVTRL